MDEERKLAEVGSGPGGATAGKADSGELYGLAGFFSAELRAAFDRVKLQLAVLDETVGLDSISIMISPKVAESFFRLVEKLVASELASSDVFNKFSDIAKTGSALAGRCWLHHLRRQRGEPMRDAAKWWSDGHGQQSILPATCNKQRRDAARSTLLPTATTGKKKGCAALWSSLYSHVCDRG